MSNAGGGYTAPGPILWETGRDSDPNTGGHILVLVATTPEHPSTDRRFSVRCGYDGSRAYADVYDQTDPEIPEGWGRLGRALREAERHIRAAWYEGGGGLKYPAPLTAAEYQSMIGRAIDEHSLTVDVADRMGVELCRECLEDLGECRLPGSCGQDCDVTGNIHGPK